MTTISATQARAHFFELMDEVCMAHKPLTITKQGKKGKNCILLSEEDWSSIQETLYLGSIPGMKESLLKSKAMPLNKGVKRLPWQTGN